MMRLWKQSWLPQKADWAMLGEDTDSLLFAIRKRLRRGLGRGEHCSRRRICGQGEGT